MSDRVYAHPGKAHTGKQVKNVQNTSSGVAACFVAPSAPSLPPAHVGIKKSTEVTGKITSKASKGGPERKPVEEEPKDMREMREALKEMENQPATGETAEERAKNEEMEAAMRRVLEQRAMEERALEQAAAQREPIEQHEEPASKDEPKKPVGSSAKAIQDYNKLMAESKEAQKRTKKEEEAAQRREALARFKQEEDEQRIATEKKKAAVKSHYEVVRSEIEQKRIQKQEAKKTGIAPPPVPESIPEPMPEEPRIPEGMPAGDPRDIAPQAEPEARETEPPKAAMQSRPMTLKEKQKLQQERDKQADRMAMELEAKQYAEKLAYEKAMKEEKMKKFKDDLKVQMAKDQEKKSVAQMERRGGPKPQ